MSSDALLSERLAVVATIDPQDITTSAVTSDWSEASLFERHMGIAMVGAILGTIDVKLQQATDSSGTGAKDITGKTATQLAGTDDNKQVIINLRNDELDVENEFSFVALVIDGGAGGANLAAGLLLGGNAKHSPASDNDLASVDEILP